MVSSEIPLGFRFLLNPTDALTALGYFPRCRWPGSGIFGEPTHIYCPVAHADQKEEDCDRARAHPPQRQSHILRNAAAGACISIELIANVAPPGRRPPGSPATPRPCDGRTNCPRCQAEKVDASGWREPPGFHLVPLPFADDIRAAPVESGFRGRHTLFLVPVTGPPTH